MATDRAPTIESVDSPPAPTFDQLGLSEVMLASLVDAEYHNPSPVQFGIIPRALLGKDVLGQARTGTGKTAAFAIPILEKLEAGAGNLPRALVLVPTRELAVQVKDEIAKLAKGRKTRCIAVYGGKPIRQQIDKLTRGADIVVGTPGRVIDLLSRNSLQLTNLEIVVLDEADRMLDIGFRPDIEKILRRCPKERQTLLLSATVAPGVERLASRYMIDPEVMDFSPKNKSVDTIEQRYFSVDEERKYELLVRLLAREEPEQAIVFCRTKRGTDRLYTKLSKKRPSIDIIHGDLQQSARDRVMRKFRDNEVQILIATDVVGRGIDVSNISHIINYDMPQSSDDYVHRVGRTGRMGREGVAYSFVTPEQGIELTRIEMLINTLLKRDEIEGFQTVAAAAPPREAPADEKPAEPKPAAPGQRPRRRHRRGL
ncbi:MAG: DEAD/DEAH box helicase [Bythopirellula sp.]|nr:DEAD/DEAH box helicase [Bythopirellula sp.]